MLKAIYVSFAALAIAACASQPDARECATGIICPDGTKCAAVQAVCITNDCGDGIVQGTEKCDDGNIIDGDGCAANCQSREVCGDGVLNAAAGEVCDDGNTTGGDGCAADCKSVEVCGNGIRDVNEACDDGNTVPGDGCSGNCKSTEVCGNGIVDLNEKCDDGGAPGGCNDDCQGGTGCGDGAIDIDGSGNPLEECDDGNSDNQDDCTNQCKLNTCGDGIVQTSGVRIEDCDPSVNFGETIDCNIDCTTAICGDNKINKARGEECDDGNNLDGDMCRKDTCVLNVCGDGDKSPTEECDDGNTNNMDGCSNICTTPHCGNGVIEMGEACDDNNTASGDGCSGTSAAMPCQFEHCHDGIVNNGEACDPGAAYDTTTCNSDCTAVTATNHCGDGKINKALGEECDDGNNLDGDFCRKDTCKLNVCGDGDKSPTEGCDDGNTNNVDGCSNACKTPTCGDGIKNGTDQCDDGNTDDTDNCLTTCLLPTCGDGFTWAGHEECDNGANNGATKNCTPVCKLNTCGDGYRDTEGAVTEACDDGNKVNETECPYGIQNCTLCNATCTAVENLVGNVCGDGTVHAPQEVCDDGNRTNEATCPYGFATCMNTWCNSTCTAFLDPAAGPRCGDGIVQSTYEGCDDGNANACGTCNATCNDSTGPAVKATGLIIAIDSTSFKDGDLFTISDGFGATVTFELDKDSMTTAGNVVISAGTTKTATQMRDAIRTAINGSALDIDATDLGSNGLKLANQHFSKNGNQPTSEMVQDADFVLTGMTGGVAGDCAAGTGCKSDDDCLSHNCTGTKTCGP